MNLYEKAQAAADYIGAQTDIRPYAVLVLGSGLGDYADAIEGADIIPYEDIPCLPKSTVQGHKARLVMGMLHGLPVAIMQGRLHYYEGYPQSEITLPVRALRLLGAEVILLTNACGGINWNFKPGDFMLITDHINFSGATPLMGENVEQFGLRFPDMSQAYDAQLLDLLRQCAAEKGIDYHEGVYMMFSGPQFETGAEIRFARTIGADAAGMSTVPEVIVARHAGMRIAGISCITNMAAGILPQPLTHEEVLETGERVKERFAQLVDGFVQKLAQQR
ncbi:purine-nucleoside phosphorylase [Eubacteriales bacterium OttesenSCG-928-N14]|nr:purine-nucleoside phosphorylase [Eubacteriales bacterium OttesenSCG-928-N14]